MKIGLSVVIITFNEERNIERCLDSIKDVADDVVIIDSFSTDRTIEICKEKNARVFSRKWEGYSIAKNIGNDLALNDYIFSIDADEALSPALAQSIIEYKKKGFDGAYSLSRLNNYCGKWIHHCGWYPDIKIRLWNRNQGKWIGTIHEYIDLPDNIKIIKLKGDLLHYSYYSISGHLMQIDKFTDIASNDLYLKRKSTNIFDFTLKPFWKFIRDYFFKLGLLDGYYGFVICTISAHATFLKYVKLKQLSKDFNK